MSFSKTARPFVPGTHARAAVLYRVFLVLT